MEGTRFILIGQAGSGKDTVANYLYVFHGFVKLSFAAKLKEIAEEMFPALWQSSRRQLLQDLGVKFREVEENCWVDFLLKDVHEYQKIVITDCRFENEYEICLKKGFTPVHINCDIKTRADRLFKRDGRRMTSAEMSHISEQLNVPCDYHLDNNHDFASLYDQIDVMVKDVVKC